MKLTRKNNGTGATKFPKFTTIGDTVKGSFVSYEEGVKGKFGLENQLVLETSDGSVMINCSANLSQIIGDNKEELEGKVLTIKYVEDKDIGKASPMKMFDVDADDADPFP